jgi:hypothetical protein
MVKLSNIWSLAGAMPTVEMLETPMESMRFKFFDSCRSVSLENFGTLIVPVPWRDWHNDGKIISDWNQASAPAVGGAVYNDETARKN